jgi:hypothetical protein
MRSTVRQPSDLRDNKIRSGGVVWTALLLITLAACSEDVDAKKADDAAKGGADTTTTSDSVVDGESSDASADVDVVVEPPKEDFWVIYARRNRLPGTNENELILTDKDNPKAITNASSFGSGLNPIDKKTAAIELTKYSFKKAGNLNCDLGCELSDNLKYVAIADSGPTTKGYSYKLGTLNDKLELFFKFGGLEDVADLHFAGDKLFYSKARNCFDTQKCQYEIRVRDMGGTDGDQLLTVMAPDTDKDVNDVVTHTTYTGRFQVDREGKTLVFLTTTIRSVKVWAWRAGVVHQLDYICEHPLDNDTCVGTGSQYHDDDEVGISPDGLTVVLFTIVDRSLRARRYSISSPATPTFSDLVTVPAGGKYLDDICFNLSSWQHAEVKSRPAFSADGKTVYFLGHSDCTGTEEKKWSDLMSIEVAQIGKPITEKDITNYTKNPRDNSTDNLWIRDFRISPERKFFALSASCQIGSSGDKLPDTDKRQTSDTEIFVMPIGKGAKAVQITNEGKYHALLPRAIVPVALQ